MELEDRRLEEILLLIPSMLIPKLKRLGVKTVADVLAIDPYEFARRWGIGGISVNLLIGIQEELKNSPRKFSEHIERETAKTLENVDRKQSRRGCTASPILIPESIDPDLPFFRNFVIFEEEYSRFSEEWGEQLARNHAIIRRRFGIHCQKMNLKQMGTYYGITRERVRQIKDRYLLRIRDMLTGKSLHRPLRQCPKEIVWQYLEFRQEVLQKKIILRSTLLAADLQTYRIPIPHLNLLMASIGYESKTYRGLEIYYDTTKFNHTTVADSISAVYTVLRDEVHPQEDISILEKVKKGYTHLSLRNEDILNILEELPDFEFVTAGDRKGYQLRFDKLPQVGLMGVRILRDVGKPMHHKDIVREINKRIAQSGDEYCVTASYVTFQLSVSKVAKAVAKSGKWVLIEWGKNTESLKNLMIQVLRSVGKEMSTEELHEGVRVYREDVRYCNVVTSLRSSSEVFVRLKSGKVQLAEWPIDKKDILPKPCRFVPEDDTEIMKLIIRIMRRHGRKYASRRWLREKLDAQGYHFSDSKFYSRITKYPIFEPVGGSRTDIRLVEDAESLISMQSPKEKTTYSYRICMKIDEILAENGGIARLNDVVKQLREEMNCTAGTVYKSISQSGFKKLEVDGKMMISTRNYKD